MRAIHRADANPPIGGGVAVKFESRVFLPSPEEKNRSTPPSLVEERKGGKHSRDQVNFHFIRRERSIIRFSLSLPFLSRYHISRGRERERGGAFLSEQRRRKKRGGKRRLAESIFARQCGSLIIYAKLSRSEREREMEDRGSYFLPVTSHYYAGRSRG